MDNIEGATTNYFVKGSLDLVCLGLQTRQQKDPRSQAISMISGSLHFPSYLRLNLRKTDEELYKHHSMVHCMANVAPKRRQRISGAWIRSAVRGISGAAGSHNPMTKRKKQRRMMQFSQHGPLSRVPLSIPTRPMAIGIQLSWLAAFKISAAASHTLFSSMVSCRRCRSRTAEWSSATAIDGKEMRKATLHGIPVIKKEPSILLGTLSCTIFSKLLIHSKVDAFASTKPGGYFQL